MAELANKYVNGVYTISSFHCRPAALMAIHLVSPDGCVLDSRIDAIAYSRISGIGYGLSGLA